MSMTARKATKPLFGSEKPRLAPPMPARSRLTEFTTAARDLGMELIPWQKLFGRYINALAQGDNWLYPEAAGVVSRQNGKTSIIQPHILSRLRMGRSVMHAAQTRELPRRSTFIPLSRQIQRLHTDAIIRRGAGQETIEMSNGAVYSITAATSGGPRGWSVDDLILDELRELEEDFVGAVLPTMAASANSQVLYLSNAGEDNSLALNAVRARAEQDASLAYLEWSAAPELAADDLRGWIQANPSIGHLPGLLPNLERQYRSHQLAGNLARFETEYLCRWVSTMRERLVDGFAWTLCKADELEAPRRPAMAVSMSPDGKRASCAVAWMRDDMTVGLRLLYNVTGNPIDSALWGADVAKTASQFQVKQIGYDSLTDAEVIKYFKPHQKPVKVHGQLFSNASAQFVNLVSATRLKWTDADAVTDDLTWTSRKADHETGTYQAVRAQDDRSITASLAAIRAVWLASGPKPPTPKVM
jgi:hypothetical protein